MKASRAKPSLKFRFVSALIVFVAVVSVFSSIAIAQIPSASAGTADYFLKLEGVDGEIAIESFSWGIISPRDAASGLPTGKRQHKPLTITKELDRATPLLFRLANDPKSRIPQATLVVPGSEGAAGYTLELKDVIISNFEHQGDQTSTPVESISFTYQKIEMK